MRRQKQPGKKDSLCLVKANRAGVHQRSTAKLRAGRTSLRKRLIGNKLYRMLQTYIQMKAQDFGGLDVLYFLALRYHTSVSDDKSSFAILTTSLDS